MRQADHLSRGALPNAVCVCVCVIVKPGYEEALGHKGSSAT